MSAKQTKTVSEKAEELFFMESAETKAAFVTFGKRAKAAMDSGMMDGLPNGSYNAVPFATTTKMKPARTDRNGKKLAAQNWLTIKAKIVGGEYDGRTITSNVNLFNEKSLAFLCQRLVELTSIPIDPSAKSAMTQFKKALDGIKGVECVFRKFENTKTLPNGESKTYTNTVIDRTA
jgi:hypothetical protein